MESQQKRNSFLSKDRTNKIWLNISVIELKRNKKLFTLFFHLKSLTNHFIYFLIFKYVSLLFWPKFRLNIFQKALGWRNCRLKGFSSSTWDRPNSFLQVPDEIWPWDQSVTNQISNFCSHNFSIYAFQVIFLLFSLLFLHSLLSISYKL